MVRRTTLSPSPNSLKYLPPSSKKHPFQKSNSPTNQTSNHLEKPRSRILIRENPPNRKSAEPRPNISRQSPDRINERIHEEGGNCCARGLDSSAVPIPLIALFPSGFPFASSEASFSTHHPCPLTKRKEEERKRERERRRGRRYYDPFWRVDTSMNLLDSRSVGLDLYREIFEYTAVCLDGREAVVSFFPSLSFV